MQAEFIIIILGFLEYLKNTERVDEFMNIMWNNTDPNKPYRDLKFESFLTLQHLMARKDNDFANLLTNLNRNHLQSLLDCFLLESMVINTHDPIKEFLQYLSDLMSIDISYLNFTNRYTCKKASKY